MIDSRYVLPLIFLALTACRDDDTAKDAPVRGLKTYRVVSVEPVQTRLFPAVLEPSEMTTLSFEIAGTVAEFDLDVGQRVRAGEVIAHLDPTTLELQLASSRAAVDQARSNAENAQEAYERQEELLKSGTTTRVAVDQARVQSDSATAQLVQAEKAYETARENLAKTELVAPFDGIVNTVTSSSFATVPAGGAIATIYPAESYEVSFSVSFDTVTRLVVGTPARVRLADRPDVSLRAVVSEIGARADSVSSFPIVLALEEARPDLKAGMAVEAALDFALDAPEGYPLPLSAIIRDGKASSKEGETLGVYVYDAGSSTVTRREVTFGGIRENMVVALSGVEPGDLVASAGVSFLKEGQQVHLLDDGE